MMPGCHYKRCHKTAETCLGEINTGEKDGYGKDWPTTIYLCKKHAKKIANQLCIELCGEEE